MPREPRRGDLCLVTDGFFAEAKVVYEATDNEGNAQCRFAENYGMFRVGDSISLPMCNVEPVDGRLSEGDRDAEGG